MIDLPSRVLVTNFSYRNALAAVRSLGKAGADVIVGGRDPKRRVAAVSKYCSGWRIYTPSSISIDKFIEEVSKWNVPDDSIRRWVAALRKAGLPEGTEA